MAKKAKPTAAAPAATSTPAPAAAAPAGAPAGAESNLPPPPPAPPAAPAPAAEPAKPAEPNQNGVTRPTEGTKTRQVWDIAESISGQKGKAATRKEVVDACTAAGINASTATTQFGKYCKFHGLTGDASPGRAEKPAAAPAPAGAPAPAPAAGGVDATDKTQEGRDAYDAAARGETVGNPYTAGSREADTFVNGWNARGAELTAGAAQ